MYLLIKNNNVLCRNKNILLNIVRVILIELSKLDYLLILIIKKIQFKKAKQYQTQFDIVTASAIVHLYKFHLGR